MTNISNLPKAELLAALYNASRQQGMGFMDPTGRLDMTAAEAQGVIDKYTYTDANNHKERIGYFDYLHGRILKVDINGDELRPHLYDRDNGQGACDSVVQNLRISLGIPE